MLSTGILFPVRLAVGPVGEEVRLRVTISDHFPVHVGRGSGGLRREISTETSGSILAPFLQKPFTLTALRDSIEMLLGPVPH